MNIIRVDGCRARSKSYCYTHYKALVEEVGLPYIPFHNIRYTYAALLMKNNINQKAVAAVIEHAKSIIAVGTYTDIQAIIEDCETEIYKFIRNVPLYDCTDAELLKEMFQGELENIDEWYLGEGQ